MISARAAANVLLAGLGALAVFHVLMLLGVLPEEMAWGGRAGGSAGSLALLESVGLIVTVLFAAVIAAKAGYLGLQSAGRAVSIAMWVVFGYFVLNVVTNLASTSSLERAIFTPVTVVLALFALRLAVSKSRGTTGR
jgi:hypothetical protein